MEESADLMVVALPGALTVKKVEETAVLLVVALPVVVLVDLTAIEVKVETFVAVSGTWDVNVDKPIAA